MKFYLFLLLTVSLSFSASETKPTYEKMNDFNYKVVCNKFGMAYYTTYSSISNWTILTPVLDEKGPITCENYFKSIKN